MKPLLRKHFSIAIFTLCALVALCVFLGRFTGLLRSRQMRVIEARDRLASFEQNRKVFSQEAKELESIKAKTAALERKLLTSESIPSLLSSLEAAAKERKVDFTITAVDQGTEAQETESRLHIGFSADGSFADIQSFVQAILSSPYQVRFDRFSLYSTGQGSSWELLAGITIISF